jgi:hypothetical protein
LLTALVTQGVPLNDNGAFLAYIRSLFDATISPNPSSTGFVFAQFPICKSSLVDASAIEDISDVEMDSYERRDSSLPCDNAKLFLNVVPHIAQWSILIEIELRY